MDRTPSRLSFPPDAERTCPDKFAGIDEVVIGGVGGSGIVGDVLVDYLRDKSPIPVSVCRSVRLPAFVGKETLFVAISYSGQTGETLGLLEQASSHKAKIAAVTSGGTLLARSVNEKIPYVKVPVDMMPRVALPEMLAATLFVMSRAGIVAAPGSVLSEVSRAATLTVGSIKASVPTAVNEAKKTAQKLYGRLPVLFASEDDVGTARRFKNELNENAKVPAFYFTFPEGYHDDVEGLRNLSENTKSQPIIIRSLSETVGQARTRERLCNLLLELGFPNPVEIQGLGKDRLAYQFSCITFGDYVSVYLAALRGVDPAELTLIPRFRQIMQSA